MNIVTRKNIEVALTATGFFAFLALIRIGQYLIAGLTFLALVLVILDAADYIDV